MSPVLYAPDQAVPDQKLYKLLLIDGWLSLITILQNALSVVAHIFLIASQCVQCSMHRTKPFPTRNYTNFY